MGVEVGEFKSMRFALVEGIAGGMMLPPVEVLPGGGATVPVEAVQC